MPILGGASVLNVQLKDVKVGFYNGEFHFEPAPVFEKKTFAQLAPLSEPFAIKVEGGKVMRQFYQYGSNFVFRNSNLELS